MRRRPGFSLVELLVSTVLIIFILVLMAEALRAALGSFRQLKAIGDMQERMRAATTLLNRDLDLDHFEGRRRLSDPNFFNVNHSQVPPDRGFFHLAHGPVQANQNEGADSEGNPAQRRTNHVLHFSVKLRGNSREHFFSAAAPLGSPLFAARTDAFDHPRDARYQDPPATATAYRSQWAEVAYFLMPLNDAQGNPVRAGTTPLYTLYRSQFVVVPDNSRLNWTGASDAGFPIPYSAAALNTYQELSCQADDTLAPQDLYFNSPKDLVTPFADSPANLKPRRAFNVAEALAGNANLRGATQLVTDVISFQVQIFRGGADFEDLPGATSGTRTYDTGRMPPLMPPLPASQQSQFTISAVRITLRVWDVKTQQTRQVTLIRDL